MNFSKIRLNNERNSHVTKRLNRLNTWNFFKVLYRENIWRVFGFSLLMIICLLPILVVFLMGSLNQTSLEHTFPVLNSFGFSTGVWEGMNEEYASRLFEANMYTGLMAAVSSVLVSIMLSGGLAVIRDAFWTGKLSTVGVFKSMGKGIKANFLYAFASTVIIAFSVFGIFAFYMWSSTLIDLWLVIVLTVLLSIVDMFVVTYLLILCSVSVTYKQTLFENLDDSWRLLWLNVLPNIIHFLLAMIPVALYFLFRGNMFQTLFMVVFLMFGGLYFPLVWQTHMMKTFALFHPIEVKKKKSTHQYQKPHSSLVTGKAAEQSATSDVSVADDTDDTTPADDTTQE